MAAVTVHVPVAELPNFGVVQLAERKGAVDHARLTLVDNGKPRAKELLGYIADELRTYIPSIDVLIVSKDSAGRPLYEDEARAIADSSDLAITGLGDCGACSACSLHDAIQLEQLGIPSTVLITEVFETVVGNMSRNLGAPGYHKVVVPHPVSSKPDDYIRKLAVNVARAAYNQLTGA